MHSEKLDKVYQAWLTGFYPVNYIRKCLGLPPLPTTKAQEKKNE